MAINETGAIYKSLTYDGKTSREFGVYITGEAVYNAPERDVEMIDIPGRNGAYALDHGRFNNIEIEYPCSIAADNETNYREALSDFRNWLCSRKGYVRLTDEYNPDEYRLAVYKSGIEVSTVQQTAGEFTITFMAKPQRFLTSGDTAISVTSGDTITNPTLFDSKPMLEITGYGSINLGSDTIQINNEPVGDIVIYPMTTKNTAAAWTITLTTQYASAGDPIYVPEYEYTVTWPLASGVISDVTYTVTGPGSAGTYGAGSALNPRVSIDNLQLAYGTSSTTTVTGTFTIVTTNYGTLTAVISVTLAYDGDSTITMSHSATRPTQFSSNSPTKKIDDVILRSSQSLLGNPLYLDLDIGEAYKIENGVPVSVNNGVIMPTQLPTLKPGANLITADNTITQLDITPRYWII